MIGAVHGMGASIRQSSIHASPHCSQKSAEF
jgi:hypothetical protein